MKLTRGTLIATAAGLLAVAALVIALRPNPLEVETALVARGPLEATVDADGRTRVRQRYVIVAPVAGRVERLSRPEGAVVRAGDVVARVAPLPLDPQGVIQARSRVDASSALALEVAAQVRVAHAALDQRRRELSRARRLAEVGGVAPRIVEECELAVREAEEAARGATERARAAEADVQQARAVLAGRAGTAGAVVLVRAPAAGRVLRVPERSERIVAAGTPLLELGDPMSLEVVIDVLSSDAAIVFPGQLVRLGEWSAANDEEEAGLTGRVREVEPAAFTKVSALGVEEQRVNVIVDVHDAPPALGDGFRVEARIVTWSAPSVLTVPVSALLRTSGTSAGPAGWSVFVARNGRAERRAVRLGHVGGGAAEVLAGLEAGEEIVTFPSDRVVTGARIATSARSGSHHRENNGGR
jgi:HlyD family secretion protein